MWLLAKSSYAVALSDAILSKSTFLRASYWEAIGFLVVDLGAELSFDTFSVPFSVSGTLLPPTPVN
jgi:hypothetical protein